MIVPGVDKPHHVFSADGALQKTVIGILHNSPLRVLHGRHRHCHPKGFFVDNSGVMVPYVVLLNLRIPVVHLDLVDGIAGDGSDPAVDRL